MCRLDEQELQDALDDDLFENPALFAVGESLGKRKCGVRGGLERGGGDKSLEWS